MKRQPYNLTNPDALRAIGGDPSFIVAQSKLRKETGMIKPKTVTIIDPNTIADVIPLEEYRKEPEQHIVQALGSQAIDVHIPAVDEYQGPPANLLQAHPHDF